MALEANIGKIAIADMETGDREIDKNGLYASNRLNKRHPNALKITNNKNQVSVKKPGFYVVDRPQPNLQLLQGRSAT